MLKLLIMAITNIKTYKHVMDFVILLGNDLLTKVFL